MQIRKSRQPKIQQDKTTQVQLPGNEVGLFYIAPEPTRGLIRLEATVFIVTCVDMS